MFSRTVNVKTSSSILFINSLNFLPEPDSCLTVRLFSSIMRQYRIQKRDYPRDSWPGQWNQILEDEIGLLHNYTGEQPSVQFCRIKLSESRITQVEQEHNCGMQENLDEFEAS